MDDFYTIPCAEIFFDPGRKWDPASVRIASIGSCFSEKFPALMGEAGMSVLSNPNGIVYNPVSMEISLERVIRGPAWTEQDFFSFGGMWHSRDHHGSFSCASLPDAVRKAEEARLRFREFLKTADLLLLTPATTVVFVEKKSGKITANCHKIPGTEFIRRLLSYEETVSFFRKMFSLVSAFNPGCFVTVGVSPVRHHPGDPVLNSRSKALLISALQEALEGMENAIYFPGYEYLHDVLRDYRFYTEDLSHPSPDAEKFILSRLAGGLFGEKGISMLREAYRLRKTMVHRERNVGE